jgi:hypothetical protein
MATKEQFERMKEAYINREADKCTRTEAEYLKSICKLDQEQKKEWIQFISGGWKQ